MSAPRPLVRTGSTPHVGNARPAHVFRPLAVGAGTAFLTVVLRLGGGLDGPLVIGLFALIVLAFPTSASLSRRIILIVPPVLGFIPLLWWIPGLFVIVDQGTVVLAAATGALAAWLTREWGRGVELRRAFPTLRAIDAVPVIVGAVAVVMHLPMLRVDSGEKAMSVLALNWDNASHFTMYSTLQAQDTVIPLLGLAGDGSRWSFQDYPQGFHAVAATASQLAFGPETLDPDEALVALARLSALISIVAAVLVSAALSSLPVMRRRPRVAFPLLSIVSAGWIFGPGALAYQHGFPNFYLGVALVVSGVVVTFTMERILLPLPLAALGASAAGVAQNWILLLVFLLPLPIIVLLPLSRIRWRARRRHQMFAVVAAAATFTGIGLALWQISAIEVSAVVSATGGVPTPEVIETALVLGTCVVLTLVASRRRRWQPPSLRRSRLAFMVIATGAVFILGFAGVQLADAGKLSYYVLKFLLAFELVALALAAVALAVVLSRPRGPRADHAGTPRARTALSLLVTLVGTQVFGQAPLAWAETVPASAAVREVEDQREALEETPEHVGALLRAVQQGQGEPAIYITTEGWRTFHPLLAQQWYSALTGTYTEASWQLSLEMFPLVGNPAAVDGVVEKIRLLAPSTRFIIDP